MSESVQSNSNSAVRGNLCQARKAEKMIRNIAKKLINEDQRRWLNVRLIQLPGSLDRGEKYSCNICGKNANQFAKFNRRMNRLCPRCFSLERHRLLYEYLKNETTLFTHAHSLLHFAAEKCLHDKLLKNPQLRYETVDLMTHFIKLIEVEPKHIASVTDIPFDENSFDVVICNHVLEHVKDDRKAMEEILRVLKPSGFAILQVPINLDSLETLEDDLLTRDERRTQYGSPDHVRYYAENDYVSRLTENGFKVTISNYVSSLDVTRCLLDSDERIYICRKS